MKEKYVKGYFALSRLLVSEFLLFNVFNVFQRPGVPDFGVVGPEAWVLSPKSRVLGPYFRLCPPRVLGPSFRLWSSQVLGPYFRLCLLL